MVPLRWFALIVGLTWTVAVAIQAISGNAPSGVWQQAMIGIGLAGSGLYGLVKGDEETPET